MFIGRLTIDSDLENLRSNYSTLIHICSLITLQENLQLPNFMEYIGKKNREQT